MYHYNLPRSEILGMAPETSDMLIAGLDWIGATKITEKPIKDERKT